MRFKTAPHEIQIGEKTYEICFNLAVLEEIQEHYGDIDIAGKANSIKEIRWILKTVIAANGGEITDEEINENICGISQFSALTDQLISAYIGDMPDSERDEDDISPTTPTAD